MDGIIVITTNRKGEPYKDCIKSLSGCKYPVETFENDPEHSEYELGGLRHYFARGYTRLFLMQDTIQVKDLSVFDIIFKDTNSVFVNPNGHSFLAKYKAEVCEKIGIPTTTTKEDSIREETNWNRLYRANDEVTVLCPDFKDGPKRAIKYGRENMVIENEYFIKYKGTWK